MCLLGHLLGRAQGLPVHRLSRLLGLLPKQLLEPAPPQELTGWGEADSLQGFLRVLAPALALLMGH